MSKLLDGRQTPSLFLPMKSMPQAKTQVKERERVCVCVCVCTHGAGVQAGEMWLCASMDSGMGVGEWGYNRKE